MRASPSSTPGRRTADPTPGRMACCPSPVAAAGARTWRQARQAARTTSRRLQDPVAGSRAGRASHPGGRAARPASRPRAAPSADVSAAVGDGSVRLVPQEVQKAAPSGTAAPHCGQVWSVNCGLLDRAGHHLARRDPGAERASAGDAAGRGSPFEPCPLTRTRLRVPVSGETPVWAAPGVSPSPGDALPPDEMRDSRTHGRFVSGLSVSAAARPSTAPRRSRVGSADRPLHCAHQT